MSSFALLTQYGPPDLLVEVGEPISADPILLSGLFKAIVTLSEVTDTPVQVIQTKGFTIEFSYLDNGFLLVVGTDHTIIGLDAVLSEIKAVVIDGLKNDFPEKEISPIIKSILENYIEGKGQIDNQHFNSGVKEAFKYLPKEFLRIILWGALTQHPFRFPKTPSTDYNKLILEILEYLDLKVCSELEQNCTFAIEFHSREPTFMIDGQEINKKKQKQLIQKTKLLKKLLKLVKKEMYSELRERLFVIRSTLSSMLPMFENFNDKTDKQLADIENLRYLIGEEMEHYLLYHLNIKDPETHTQVIKNTEQLEWMNNW